MDGACRTSINLSVIIRRGRPLCIVDARTRTPSRRRNPRRLGRGGGATREGEGERRGLLAADCTSTRYPRYSHVRVPAASILRLFALGHATGSQMTMVPL